MTSTTAFHCINLLSLLLSWTVTDAGTGFIHKSKWNANGTFSIGKTWNLSELRGIEVNVRTHSLTPSCDPPFVGSPDRLFCWRVCCTGH